MLAVTTIGDDRVEVREHPDPVPGEGEVRVRVVAAGLNRADLLQRAGLYPAPSGAPVDIPGLEFSGVVEAVGPGASLDEGTRVFGICGGGGQATSLVVPARQCATVPDGLDLVAMGGVPEVFVTAHDAMITQAATIAGDWVLVHAVGSGVGTAATQLAKASGARVVGTARTPEKLERARALGLDVGVVAPQTDDGDLDSRALASSVREITGQGADVILDLVGGPYVEADVAAAAPRGRIVLIGALAGGSARLSVLDVMQKRLTIRGTVLRPRSVDEKAAAVAAFSADVVPQLERGDIVPAVEQTFALRDVAAAYELLASDTTFGKVILEMPPV